MQIKTIGKKLTRQKTKWRHTAKIQTNLNFNGTLIVSVFSEKITIIEYKVIIKSNKQLFTETCLKSMFKS